jgi:hypothetical protein
MMHSHNPVGVAVEERSTGPVVAALMAVLCGEFALLLADKISNRSKAIESSVYSLGKWMPGATGTGAGGSIGPYSGKETIALIVWCLSWVILHAAMRKASPSVAKSLYVFLIGLTVITVNFIDPIADWTFAFVNWF